MLSAAVRARYINSRMPPSFLLQGWRGFFARYLLKLGEGPDLKEPAQRLFEIQWGKTHWTFPPPPNHHQHALS